MRRLPAALRDGIGPGRLAPASATGAALLDSGEALTLRAERVGAGGMGVAIAVGAAVSGGPLTWPEIIEGVTAAVTTTGDAVDVLVGVADGLGVSVIIGAT